MPLSFEEIELTPAIAAEFLTKIPAHQRKISPHHVAKLASQMSAGAFLYTPQPIIFDWDGNLHDGQHRAQAVVRSGVAIRVLVVRGADPATFSIVDTGKSRQAAEFIPGKNAPILSSAARQVLSYRNAGGRLSSGQINSSRSMIGNNQILDELRADPEYTETAPQAAAIRRCAKVPAAPILAIHILASRNVDPDKSTLWLDGLETGAELSVGDPRLTLRNRFGADDGRLAHDTAAQWVYIVRAWNAWNTGREIRVLRFRRGRSEAIPAIFGAAA